MLLQDVFAVLLATKVTMLLQDVFVVLLATKVTMLLQDVFAVLLATKVDHGQRHGVDPHHPGTVNVPPR